MEPKDIAISLIVYCNEVDKFLEIIRGLKAEPEKILPVTFECAIKALRLNSRGLESHSEEIFNVTLFTHNFMLNEDLISRSVQIFKFLSRYVFSKFLVQQSSSSSLNICSDTTRDLTTKSRATCISS